MLRYRMLNLMQLPSIQEIHAAQSLLSRFLQPTPQYSWPLLNLRLKGNIWVKHENHSPVGAFKLRGALVYTHWLCETHPRLTTLVAATRGNHGQGVALSARLHNLQAIIVVPIGNSVEKNQAMRAQGASLIEHGHDFQESLEYARTLANSPGHAMIESMHSRLVMGTATYAMELFSGAPALDRVYVPIGLGSSICGVSAARNALGLGTEIIGVVASASPSYARSFHERRIVECPSATRIADGLACRLPNPDAMSAIWANVARIVEVTDAEIAQAMRIYYQDTHNLAEGAGAAALAGAFQEINHEPTSTHSQQIGVILTGGNVDSALYQRVLQQEI